MFSRYIGALFVLALAAEQITSQSWYPANFASPGGEQICLNDGAHPAWIEDQGLLMQSLDECCSRYFGFMLGLVCTANSNGVTYTGSGLYYPKYQGENPQTVTTILNISTYLTVSLIVFCITVREQMCPGLRDRRCLRGSSIREIYSDV